MAITFNTIPNNIRVPLWYAEMDNSKANKFTSNLRALVIGQKTTGTATASELTLIDSVETAKAQGGVGSHYALMAEYFRKSNNSMELWGLPIADAGTKATGTITIGGTVSAGTISLYIGAVKLTVDITASDTTTTVATAIKDAINANVNLPVTATGASAVVTVTAKNGGAIGNDIKLILNYKGTAANERTPTGLTVTLSNLDANTGYGSLSGGTGTFTLPVAALGDEEFDFIILPQADATTLDLMKVEMNDSTGRWAFNRNIFGHVYTALRGTAGTLQTFGSGRNNQHETVAGFENGVPNSVWEMAASYAAANAMSLASDPAMPTQTVEMVGVYPAKPSQRFAWQQRSTLLNSGIGTMKYSGGALRVERAITTYQKNAYDVADVSYFDSESMHTSAYFLRRMRSMVTSKFGRCKLANDGTAIGAGQEVVTPQIMRGEVAAEYAVMESLGIVENAKAFLENTIIERNADDPNRLDMLLAPDYVNQLRVVAVKNQFRLQY